jgi:glycerophosphoryl diester phosphodiesterase
MENIRLVAHRGERGEYTENSLGALEAAVNTKADAVEFDVQLTKDKQLVVCHDRSSPLLLYGITKPIREITLKELRGYRSKSGDTIPSLEEVLKIKFAKPFALDIKDADSAKRVAKVLKAAKIQGRWMATSLHPEALTELRELFPGLELNLQTFKHPFKTIKRAKAIDAESVTLVLYLLNPLTYYLARRAGLRVFTYQNYFSFLLNTPWFVRPLWFFYPNLAIVSNRPGRLATYVKR